MGGFLDIHHHLIYGIDDGPNTFNEMTGMILSAQKDGIEAIIATPHVYPGIRPFDAERYKERLKEAREWCEKQNVPMKIFSGAEVLYTPQLSQMLWEDRVPKMRDGDCVLVEFVPDEKPDVIESALKGVARSGSTPIIAHVERIKCLPWHLRRFLEFKKNYDALFQVNCNSLLTKKDMMLTRALGKLFSEEKIDFLATDAHNTTSRRVKMTDAYNVVAEKYGKDYADRLTGRK